MEATATVKLVKIEGTEVKGLGCKYNTEDGKWRIVPVKTSTKYAGVGHKRMHYVEWIAYEMKGDREFKAPSLDSLVAKISKVA